MKRIKALPLWKKIQTFKFIFVVLLSATVGKTFPSLAAFWRHRVALHDDVSLLPANMAKNQRGEAASSSKMTVIENEARDFSLVLASSEDEAPDEVTFEDSKAQALRSMKQALDTARR